MVEVYRRPSRGFPQWFPKWLRGRLSIDRLEAMSSRIDDAKVGAKVEELAADLRRVAKAVAGGTTAAALAVIRDEIGLGGAMGMLDSSRAGEGGSSHLDDLEALAQVAALHPDAASFEPWLRDVLRREPTPGGVTLSTVHRVKGREWDRVVVFGATAGLVPHRLAEDVEEERRVLHVAITRGRHRVAVLGDASRPSPFLAELDGTASHDRPEAAPPSDWGSTADRRGQGPRQPTVLAALPADAEATEAALRAWRTERARRDAVPPYIVLSDKYLRGVAVARPASLVALRTLPGIGPTKLELYGDEILAAIAAAAGLRARSDSTARVVPRTLGRPPPWPPARPGTATTRDVGPGRVVERRVGLAPHRRRRAAPPGPGRDPRRPSPPTTTRGARRRPPATPPASAAARPSLVQYRRRFGAGRVDDAGHVARRREHEPDLAPEQPDRGVRRRHGAMWSSPADST